MENVFVLIRTTMQSYSPYTSKETYGYFREALKSVLTQSYSNITVVILQDCWWKPYSKPKKIALPKFCTDIVREVVDEGYFSTPEILFYSSNSRGAAHALYNIRQIAMNLSSNDDDIVVMLDDDDVFASKTTIEDIVLKMSGSTTEEKAQLCISKFQQIGAVTEIGLVNKGGGNHNKLVDLFHRYPNATRLRDSGLMCFADSLGWTKSYRVGVLREYYDDLTLYFGSNRRMQQFFKKYDAFEDFPEIINLCRANVKVAWLDKETHSYRKHQHSVTARTRRQDFRVKRPIYLALLIGLYDMISGKLRAESNTIIVRYCIVKILTIENILAKFKITRYKYLRRWFINLANGSFLKVLLSVFREQKVLKAFMDMIAKYPYLGDADFNKSNISVISEVCKVEANRGFVDIVSCMQEKELNFQVRRLFKHHSYKLYAGLAFLISIVIFVILSSITPSSENYTAIITSIATLIGGLYTIYRKRKTENELQEKQTLMFSDAISELRRHIMANTNVLLEIRTQLEDAIKATRHFQPSKVHLSNLKVSSHSFFMSDTMDKYIIIDEFKELSHLRVHIRNINNSATYLEEYAGSTHYDEKIMLRFVDWELARSLGYIISLMYFNENRAFHFPSKNQVLLFAKNRDAIEAIANDIILQGTHRNKICLLRRFFNDYRTDRNIHRSILNMK